jgi:hypothetical protein
VISPLIVHPLLAGVVVLMVISAYLLKTMKRHYFSAHYATGVLAFAFFIMAVPIGVYEVAETGGPSVYPEVLMFHLLNFGVAGTLIIVQCGLGAAMLLFGRRRRIYALHRLLSKYVLVVVLLQGALGLAVLAGILPYI